MLHNYLDCDFYWVRLDEDGNKVIVPYGFGYDTDVSVDGVAEHTCRFDYYWSDFEFYPRDMDEEDFDYYELSSENVCETEDLSEDELLELLYNGACEGEGHPRELPITEVNEDTPCGWYVNYPNPFDN